MGNILEKLESIDKLTPILDYIYALNETEVKILIFVTALLLALITLKWFGVKVLAALLFVYLFAYVMYANDFVGEYREREKEHNAHMEMIEDYMPGIDD